MRPWSLFFTFFIFVAASPGRRSGRTEALWEAAQRGSLGEAVAGLLNLSEGDAVELSGARFEAATKRVHELIMSKLAEAERRGNVKEFSAASAIYREVLANAYDFLDQTFIKYCEDQLATTTFREAIVGNVTWEVLAAVLESTGRTTDFNYHLAVANIANKVHMDELPYVVKFHMPHVASTPTLAHFGHVSILVSFLLHASMSSLRPCWMASIRSHWRSRMEHFGEVRNMALKYLFLI
jgi:hypothetical protein